MHTFTNKNKFINNYLRVCGVWHTERVFIYKNKIQAIHLLQITSDYIKK